MRCEGENKTAEYTGSAVSVEPPADRITRSYTDPDDSYTMRPIGVIRTPYGQKFAVPRQPDLACDADCEIELFPPYSDPLSVSGLELFSHIHVLFLFDQVKEEQVSAENFKPRIRPPRLGGNKRVGVFASRSPFRPNRIGLSVLRLRSIEIRKGRAVLKVPGADMVDGTPVLDIKPYITFVDAKSDAVGGYALQPPELKKVVFTPYALSQLPLFQISKEVLTQILAQDPRPAYKKEHESEPDRSYYALIGDSNVEFKVRDKVISVIALHDKDSFFA